MNSTNDASPVPLKSMYMTECRAAVLELEKCGRASTGHDAEQDRASTTQAKDGGADVFQRQGW